MTKTGIGSGGRTWAALDMGVRMRYQIRHALVQFGADVILQDVNFEVHDNEKIAIVGRNGCGKTTLLKLIAGDIQRRGVRHHNGGKAGDRLSASGEF